MAEEGAAEVPKADAESVTEDMLAGVDDIFDRTLSGMFPEGGELTQDKEDVLRGFVGVFDERLKVVEEEIRAQWGDGAVPEAALERRSALVALRDKAAERFNKETGKDWTEA